MPQVVDKKTLNLMAISIASFFGTVSSVLRQSWLQTTNVFGLRFQVAHRSGVSRGSFV